MDINVDNHRVSFKMNGQASDRVVKELCNSQFVAIK